VVTSGGRLVTLMVNSGHAPWASTSGARIAEAHKAQCQSGDGFLQTPRNGGLQIDLFAGASIANRRVGACAPLS
jgi:hypothetical protein